MSPLILAFIMFGSRNIIDASVINSNSFDGSDLKVAYQLLNVQLARRVPNSDPDLNFKAAKELLQQPGNSNKLSSACELFLSMSQLSDDNMCSPEAINILKQNDLASSERIHKRLDKHLSRTRVEKILLQIAARLAEECPRVYANLLERKLAEFNAERYSLLRELTDAIIWKHVVDINSKTQDVGLTLYKLATQTAAFIENDLTDGNKFYYLVQKIVKSINEDRANFLELIDNTGNGIDIFDKDKLKEIYDKYALIPCRDFVETFGVLLERPTITYLASIYNELILDDKLHNFYINMISYNVCKIWIKNYQSLLESGIEERGRLQ